jgi:hypothetical protein
MEVAIKRRDCHGKEENWKYFYFIPEESIYENERIMFAHWIWREISKQTFGNDFTYLRDYYDYNSTFNRLSYSGEGWYRKGRKVMGVEDMQKGFLNNMIEIKNYLYFIEK